VSLKRSHGLVAVEDCRRRMPGPIKDLSP
jgi:hypothetical protein